MIHSVPHSHNDAGWLRSFDEYYQETTKHILTNVINLLLNEDDKKFNWSDIAFFHKWWMEQDNSIKTKTRELVKNNRFVFMGGGWVMNDEALPSYKEVMLQMRLGLDFLQDEFGVRPNIGWQIDPFGSSTVTISVLHKLGYDGIVGNRMSQTFKNKLAKEDGFNFYWQGHQVSKNPEDATLFTHILQKHYGLQLPNVWNEGLFLGKNMDQLTNYVYSGEIEPTVEAIDHLSNNKENDYHVMVTAGDDFMFREAERVFGKFDELNIDLEKVRLSKIYFYRLERRRDSKLMHITVQSVNILKDFILWVLLMGYSKATFYLTKKNSILGRIFGQGTIPLDCI